MFTKHRFSNIKKNKTKKNQQQTNQKLKKKLKKRRKENSCRCMFYGRIKIELIPVCYMNKNRHPI